jgi:hypothetical protein
MAATSAPAGAYLAAPNRVVSPANGIAYAYRQVGDGAPACSLDAGYRRRSRVIGIERMRRPVA